MPRGVPPTHWVAPDLGSGAKAVRIAQERFLTGEDGAVSSVRSMVLDSWRRSVREGVDPASDAPPLVWNADEGGCRAYRQPAAGGVADGALPHTHLTIDLVPGRGAGFSLEAPTGYRFMIRSRLSSDEEYAALQA